MKKQTIKEVSFCDKCGKEDSYPTACLSCGTEMCYECQKKHGQSYNHGVYVCGSDDGFYCHACDRILTVAGDDKRYNAYRTVKMLRDELDRWGEDFKKRQEVAERAVKDFAND